MNVLAEALRSFKKQWLPLLQTDLLYKAIAFAVLMPLIGLLFRLLLARSGSTGVADVDIALFFFTTKPGFAALILVTALVIAVVALEQACLMTLGLAHERRVRLRVRDAFAHGATNAFAILRMTVFLVFRLLLIALPFVAAAGATYWGLLRSHDINYYLTDKPPAFWTAAAIVGAIALVLAVVLARKITAWVLVIPLVVFENVRPVFAFGQSAKRMQGRRMTAALALAAWSVAALALPYVASKGLQALGRVAAPAFSGSLAAMLLFIGMSGVIWLIVTVVIGMVANALFALIVVQLYQDSGAPEDVKLPPPVGDHVMVNGRVLPLSWKGLVAVLIVAMIGTGVLANFLLKTTWTDRPVLVFAHRGAASEAPENTLASFKRAIEDRTDYVELDVQESSDGVVLVAHDADLMKVARSPLKIWQSPAAELQAVDIGSYFSPAFADQRVPALAEVLALCKGAVRMDIELKDYGHDVHLEQSVVDLVEAAGMQDHIVTMSLSLGMVEKMKSLRPKWTSGLLLAKGIGNLSRLEVDFLAPESRTATRRFIRQAHAAGKPVYVWTVDDANRMIRMIGLGADGLITNKPDLAKQVIAEYAQMSRPQRLFLFVMTTLGASNEISEPANNLRP